MKFNAHGGLIFVLKRGGLIMDTIVMVGAAVFCDGRFLLLKRLETKSLFPGYYDVPGGKIEPGEDPNDAVLRELKEETGLEGKVIRPYNVWITRNVKDGRDRFYIEIDYIVGVDDCNKILLCDKEHSGYEWVDRNNIPEQKISPELRKTVLKAFDEYKR